MTLPRTLPVLAVLAALAAAPSGAGAQSAAGLSLPRHSRAADPARPDLLFVSGAGFRDTVEHVRKQLLRRGIDHEAIPVYRRRGIAVARFVARGPNAPFRAVHVFHDGARTFLAIVPLPPPATP